MKNSRRRFLQRGSAAAASFGLFGCGQSSIAHSPPSSPSGAKESQSCIPTTLDAFGEGPFYTQNPPIITNTVLASNREPGERMIIQGRLFNLDCSQILPDTVIDIWHANAAGDYDNIGQNLRGQTLTDSEGYYRFETVKPGKYLNGRRYRPAHIHFKITPSGFQTLTTQLYFEGDADLSTDASTRITTGRFDARERIIPLSTTLDGKLKGVFDIVVNG